MTLKITGITEESHILELALLTEKLSSLDLYVRLASDSSDTSSFSIVSATNSSVHDNDQDDISNLCSFRLGKELWTYREHKQLQCLNLRGQVTFSPNSLIALLEGLPNLQSLGWCPEFVDLAWPKNFSEILVYFTTLPFDRLCSGKIQFPLEWFGGCINSIEFNSDLVHNILNWPWGKLQVRGTDPGVLEAIDDLKPALTDSVRGRLELENSVLWEYLRLGFKIGDNQDGKTVIDEAILQKSKWRDEVVLSWMEKQGITVQNH
ncbi:hypothetical protein BGZ60DRAFT_526783 [Tricladium varicosporioides]|nr:hypothetical protein BGZ60DRAFT_526783 [Hymenoscyphus varicosporioides]